MANQTSTLNTPQREVKKPLLTQILGGVIGEFEEITETIFRGPKMPEHQAGAGTTIGGVSELRFNQPSEEIQFSRAQAVLEQYRRLPQEILAQAMTQSTKATIEEKREEVNKTVGGLQLSYADSVNNQGEIRIDLEPVYENARMRRLEEAELKQQRQAQLAKATGQKGPFIVGENELLKGGENQNHWTKGMG